MHAHLGTLVVFHAHPDDECLLTAGTMARAAASGHRVILVVATDGDLGNREQTRDRGLGDRRQDETARSGHILGADTVEFLGFADSGTGSTTPPGLSGMVPFVEAPLDQAAARLATILRDVRADVLVTDDRYGGYGHRDHVQAHRVGVRAAQVAGTPRRLEATIPRARARLGVSLTSRRRRPAGNDTGPYTARSVITHRVPVHRFSTQKRESLRAHATQSALIGGADRNLAAVARVPQLFSRLIFGWEWFIDAQHDGPVSPDIFDGAHHERD